jgi:CRP-like cAMP-binding protein
MDNDIKQQLVDYMVEASLYKPMAETLERFIEAGEKRHYTAGTAIIKEGLVNDHLFCVEDGVFRNGYRVDGREVTHGFGSRGALFFSPIGFLTGEKAFYFFEAVVDSTIIVWNKDFVNQYLVSAPDFALWMLGLCIKQFFFLETKSMYMSVPARERYEALFNGEWNSKLRVFGHFRRPELMSMVSSKVLASYLRITPSYLSYLRNPKGIAGSAPKKDTGAKRKSAPKKSESGTVVHEIEYGQKGFMTQSVREVRKNVVVELLRSDPSLTVKGIAAATGFGLRTVKTYLSELTRDGLVRRIGSHRAGHWKT